MLEATTIISALQMGVSAIQEGQAIVAAASNFYNATKEKFSGDSQNQIEGLLAAAAGKSDAAGVKAEADLGEAAKQD